MIGITLQSLPSEKNCSIYFCAMVRLSYADIEDSYEEIKQSACGRQACSVLIMVAYEVIFLYDAEYVTF